MTSYYENRERKHGRNEWIGFVALACAVPILFFGLFYLFTGLQALTLWMAGWFA